MGVKRREIFRITRDDSSRAVSKTRAVQLWPPPVRVCAKLGFRFTSVPLLLLNVQALCANHQPLCQSSVIARELPGP